MVLALPRLTPLRTLTTSNSGSMFILTSFLVMSLTLICFSYWKLIEYKLRMTQLQEKSLQAMMCARAGIEDALAELRLNHDWEASNNNLSSQWVKTNPPVFYKSSSGAIPLTQFDYPVTFSVQIIEGPSAGELTIESVGEVGDPNLEPKSFSYELYASAIKSSSGELFLKEVKGK